MIVALLGDIHGNHLALKKVLGEIRKDGIKHLLIAGDLVGYYYHPDRVFEELASWSYEIIQGNHDRMLGEIYSGNKELRILYMKKYGSGIDTALEVLSEKECEYLSNLPAKKEILIGKRKILLCHGSPWDQDVYIYPDSSEETFQRCAEGDFDIVMMGHTHYPMEKRVNSTILLNPGSVGQPRNYIPGTDWATLNLDTLEVRFKHSIYDVSSLVAEAQQNDAEVPYLAQVLLRERKL